MIVLDRVEEGQMPFSYWSSFVHPPIKDVRSMKDDTYLSTVKGLRKG